VNCGKRMYSDSEAIGLDKGSALGKRGREGCGKKGRDLWFKRKPESCVAYNARRVAELTLDGQEGKRRVRKEEKKASRVPGGKLGSAALGQGFSWQKEPSGVAPRQCTEEIPERERKHSEVPSCETKRKKKGSAVLASP